MHGELRKRIRTGGIALCVIGILFILISVFLIIKANNLSDEARDYLEDDDIKKYIEKNIDADAYGTFGLLFATAGASILICGITLVIVGKPKKLNAYQELEKSYKDGLLTEEEYAKGRDYLKILEKGINE